jgi:hypothetical protein
MFLLALYFCLMILLLVCAIPHLKNMAWAPHSTKVAECGSSWRPKIRSQNVALWWRCCGVSANTVVVRRVQILSCKNVVVAFGETSAVPILGFYLPRAAHDLRAPGFLYSGHASHKRASGISCVIRCNRENNF